MTLLSYISLSMSDGFDWSARATGIFAAASAMAFLLRKRSASTRHLVWSAALLGSMLLPLVKWSVPGWELPSWPKAEVAETVPDSKPEYYHVDLSYVFTPLVDE